MWQRIFGPGVPSWKGSLKGDGCGALEDQEHRVSLQHPWMAGAPVYAPDNWSSRYDYPLICYLHDDNRSEYDLWNWFPAISDQNYLGLGVRAPFPARSLMPGQFRWRGQRPDATAAVLHEAVETVQFDWNLHPDRIFLFGEGNGAVAALQQFMLNQLRSDDDEIRYSGVICRTLPDWWTRALPPVAEFASGRILLMNPHLDDDGETSAAIDGLCESGLSVTLSSHSETSPASEINHWIMSGIATAVF